MLKYLFAVLSFALSITFLMSWGMIKEQRKHSDLYQKLLVKVQGEVRKNLKKEKTLSKKELIHLIKDTKTKLFWSKSNIQVTNPESILNQALDKMVENKEIIENNKKYELINDRRLI